MTPIQDLKIRLFDILRKQAQLQDQINDLEKVKNTLMTDLKKEEEGHGDSKSSTY